MPKLPKFTESFSQCNFYDNKLRKRFNPKENFRKFFLEKLDEFQYPDEEGQRRKEIFTELESLYFSRGFIMIYLITKGKPDEEIPSFKFLCITKSNENSKILNDFLKLKNLDLNMNSLSSDIEIKCSQIALYPECLKLIVFNYAHFKYFPKEKICAYPLAVATQYCYNLKFQKLSRIWTTTGKHRNPFCISDIKNFLQGYWSVSKPLFEYLSDILIRENILFKDVFENYNFFKNSHYDKKCLFPKVALYKIYESHNMRELIAKTHGVKLSKIPKAVNRADLTTAYFVTLAMFHTADNERQKLIFMLQKNYLKDNLPEKSNFYYQEIIKHYYQKTLRDCPNFRMYIVEDYVHMLCPQDYDDNNPEIIFPLNFKSFNALSREHDRLNYEHFAQRTDADKNPKIEITIPENSKFNTLSLPESYEKITTQERLSDESKELSHCVWSYTSRINDDICAVYSMVFEDKRYTLEVRKKKYRSKEIFYIAQFRGFSNKACPNELMQDTQKLIDAVNKAV